MPNSGPDLPSSSRCSARRGSVVYPTNSTRRMPGAGRRREWETRAEHIAPVQFLGYGSDELLDLVLDAYRTFGVSIVGEMHPSASGEIGSIDEEAPSIQLIRSPEHTHTDWDVSALIPSVGLEAVARAYAKIIDGVNQLSLADLQTGEER